MRHRAFTLVELLVVVAVIGILIGVLLPALGSARGASQATIDTANLRSMQQGGQLYSDTYDAFMPFRMPEGSHHRATGRHKPRWHWFVGDLLGQPFMPQGDAEREILLTSDAIPRIDNMVFLDPTQTVGHAAGADGVIKALRNGSYGYNYHYLGNSRTNNPDPRFDRFPVSPNRVRQPSVTISFADALGNQETFGATGAREHAYTLDPPRLDTDRNNAQGFAQSSGKSPAHARHLGKANAVFLDGHVKALSLEEFGYNVVDPKANRVEHDGGSNALFNGRGHDPEATGSAKTP